MRLPYEENRRFPHSATAPVEMTIHPENETERSQTDL